MAKINSRSPYFINLSEANLESATIKIWIYSGTQTGSIGTGTATYTLISNAVSNAISFDISQLVNDYLDGEFDGDYATVNYWVEYKITKVVSGTSTELSGVRLTAFEGYGYFEEGINPTLQQDLLQSNNRVIKLDDATLRIPVDTSTTTSVTFLNNGEEIYAKTVSSSTDSNNQIEYVTNSYSGYDDYQSRVIGEGGILESSPCLEDFFDDYILFPVDTVYVNGTDVSVVRVDSISECKYEPIKLTFINKFGALQDLWFFKTSKLSIKTDEEEYRANIISSNTYSTSKHQYRNLFKSGRESLKVNSGFYLESYNEVFKELLLSNKAWVYYTGKTLPVQIKTSDMEFKTSLNDSLIQYSLELEFAYDKINNVR